jgi:hypothetical protein
MLLPTKNAHPRDKRIYMDEPTHIYYLDGNPVSISGTGFIHLFFSHFDSKTFSKKLAEGAKEGSKYYGMTAEQIADKWKAGASNGTDKHKNVEDFWNMDLDIDKLDYKLLLDKKKYGCFLECFNFIKSMGLKSYFTEKIVFSEEDDIAGSVDFIAYNPDTGKYWVIDWKFSVGLRRNSYGGKCGIGPCKDIEDCNGNHYQIQVNLYKYILEKYYGIEVEQMLLVNLHEDRQSPDYLFAEDMGDLIQDMLKYWRDNKTELLKIHNSRRH